MSEEETQAVMLLILLTACGLVLEAFVTIAQAWEFISHYLGV